MQIQSTFSIIYFHHPYHAPFKAALVDQFEKGAKGTQIHISLIFV